MCHYKGIWYTTRTGCGFPNVTVQSDYLVDRLKGYSKIEVGYSAREVRLAQGMSTGAQTGGQCERIVNGTAPRVFDT